MELLEIMTLAYQAAEEWEIIGPLLGDQLFFSFVGIQLIAGALIPIILLAKDAGPRYVTRGGLGNLSATRRGRPARAKE